MYSMYGTQRLHVLKDKRIVKSSAVGETNPAEIRWLAKNIIEAVAPWTEEGWVYIVNISKLLPVSAEASREIIELHKLLEKAGCKAIVFVDADSLLTAMQAKKHQRKAKVAYTEKHFKTEEEALLWSERVLAK